MTPTIPGFNLQSILDLGPNPRSKPPDTDADQQHPQDPDGCQELEERQNPEPRNKGEASHYDTTDEPFDPPRSPCVLSKHRPEASHATSLTYCHVVVSVSPAK
jgi:hypothetical protein